MLNVDETINIFRTFIHFHTKEAASFNLKSRTQPFIGSNKWFFVFVRLYSLCLLMEQHFRVFSPRIFPQN